MIWIDTIAPQNSMAACLVSCYKFVMQEAEIWKPVVGYEARYEVSNFGRVRVSGPDSLGRTTFIGLIRKQAKTNGYCSVTLGQDGFLSNRHVHILVARAFLGLPPAGMEVNHINGDRADPPLSNLEYVTESRNTLHAIEDLGKRWCVGTNNNFSKFSDEQVLQVRRMKAEGRKNVEIAKEIGASKGWVSLIVRMKERRHDQPKPDYDIAAVSNKKLTVESVLKIREMALTMRKIDIARALGVGPMQVHYVVTRKSWRHV